MATRFTRSLLLPALATLLATAGCAAQPDHASHAAAAQTTVLWISIDGMRGDYLTRVQPPFLTRLMHEGAYTLHLRPAFPSITFPSHTAEATGVPVSGNGIPGNSFYDAATHKLWEYPPDGAALRAEPIWNTATRQHVRTAVFDWPLSQMQTGPNAAAYFNHAPYDKKLTDAQRLDRLVDAYEHDHAGRPLRLLMGYVEATDPVGHKYGPDSREIDDNLRATDTLLQNTFTRIDAVFEKHKHPGDVLCVLVSTDHGMENTTTGINLQLALGLPKGQDATVVTSGPVGNIYLDPNLPERAKRLDDFVGLLKSKSYASLYQVYRQNELPPDWHYTDPSRIGDIVVVCTIHATFEPKLTTESGPLPDGPKGMHGYPVEWDPNMEGGMVMWRSDHPWNPPGRDLGPINTTQLESTVAAWLDIHPAPNTAPPIPLP